MDRYPVVLLQSGFSLFAAFTLLAFIFTPFGTASAAAEGQEIALLVGEAGGDYERHRPIAVEPPSRHPPPPKEIP